MFKFHFKRGLVFGVLGALTGFLIAWFTPKVYEATAEMLLGEATVASSQMTLTADVQRILEVGQASDANTELQVLRSQTIFFQALRKAASARNDENLVRDWVRLYLMYDVLTPEQRVTQQDQGSVAMIRVRANDAKLAEEIAQAVTEVYNDLRTQNGRQGLQNAMRYLSAQESATKKALDEAETKYKDYATANGIVNIDVTTQAATQLESNALTRLNEAKAQAAGASAEVTALESSMSSFPTTVSNGSLVQKPTELQQLEGQRGELIRKRAELSVRYYDDHPRMKEVNDQIAKIDAEIKSVKSRGLEQVSRNTDQINPTRQAMEQQLAIARSKRDSLQQQVNEAEAAYTSQQNRMKSLPNDERMIRQFRRELEVADGNYRRVKAQLDELKSRQQTGIRVTPVLSDAKAYIEPVAPDRGKFIFIGLIAGLCIGLIYSFVVEGMKLRVHTSQQLADLTGLPVVATIPALGRGKQKGLATYTKPGAKPGESFRHMAYTFLAKNHDFPRTMMFTAVGNAVGRTSSAVQFGIALANAGTKVLIVDCDPVRGLASKAFGAEARSGLSEIFNKSTLSNESGDVFASTVHDNLSVLPIGTDPSKTLADRSVAQLESVMDFLKSQAEVVIFDCPPCDMFADASRIAGLVDETCMVVSASTTNYNQIPNGYEILHRAGSKEVNLVLTDASANEEAFGDATRYSRGA